LEPFRAELRAFLEEHAPHSLRGTALSPFQGHWGGRKAEFESDDQKRWFEVMLERGLTAPTWPNKYGGGGLSMNEFRVFKEELTRLGLPLPLVGFGLVMIGPILLSAGSEAQKDEHLPKIVRGEIRWCQGYSEPNAGSDLASLGTRAVVDGDELVINGQKIWTSHANHADWIFCLVRTRTEGKRQAGITFVLMDMATAGISTRPIELISGASPFCEVFFEDVRAPLSNVIGEMHDGWRVAKALLAHERGMVGESVAAGGARAPILSTFNLRDYAIDKIGLTDGILDDALLRHKIIQSEMDQQLMRATIRRANDRMRVGHQPGPESSIFKIVGTELNMRRWQLAVQIGGLDSLGWEGDAYTDIETAMTRQWLRSRGNSIEGGTSEVQRNIIARHVLGLPK